MYIHMYVQTEYIYKRIADPLRHFLVSWKICYTIIPCSLHHARHLSAGKNVGTWKLATLSWFLATALFGCPLQAIDIQAKGNFRNQSV